MYFLFRWTIIHTNLTHRSHRSRLRGAELWKPKNLLVCVSEECEDVERGEMEGHPELGKYIKRGVDVVREYTVLIITVKSSGKGGGR